MNMVFNKNYKKYQNYNIKFNFSCLVQHVRSLSSFQMPMSLFRLPTNWWRVYGRGSAVIDGKDGVGCGLWRRGEGVKEGLGFAEMIQMKE